jgi:hypothetical protein
MRFQGHRRRRQEDDGYSNNKRSNGSNTYPLKSTILIPERGPTPGWVCGTKRRAKRRAKRRPKRRAKRRRRAKHQYTFFFVRRENAIA